MAAREGYEKGQVITSDGHAIRIFQKYSNFKDTLPIFFYDEFIFNCSASPTLWSIRVVFVRGLMNDDISCQVTVQRTDHLGIALDVDLWLRVVPPFDSNIAVSPKFRVNGMLPNFQAMEQIDNFVSNEFLKQLQEKPVTLKVFLRIQGCHQGSEKASEVKEYFPPLTQKEISVSKM